MSILILGLTVIAMILIAGTAVVTSAQISRLQLLDAADGAALDAADALDASSYDRGFDEAVVVTDATVIDAASSYLARRPRPPRITAWSLAPGTGTLDGQTAVVRLTGRAQLPVFGEVLANLGAGITITVEGSARAGLVD